MSWGSGCLGVSVFIPALSDLASANWIKQPEPCFRNRGLDPRIEPLNTMKGGLCPWPEPDIDMGAPVVGEAVMTALHGFNAFN